jgi:hypothetical protein
MGKPRGRPFLPGNTVGRGRPKGSRNKAFLLQELLEAHGEPLLRKCLVNALQGERYAMRLCIERLLPPRREGVVRLALPVIRSLADVNTASDRVIRAIARGQITPAQGETMTAVLADRRRAIESADLERRIELLERLSGDTERH